MTGEATQNEHDAAVLATVPPPSRRRFQFSLATLFWLTALVGCLVALAVMYRDLRKAKAELQAARDEVEKYRGEMGYLIITDPKKIYARSITTRPNRWSWRVYLPPGHVYEMPVTTTGIPWKGLPSSRCGTMMSLRPGEHVINANMEKERDGKWHAYIVIPDMPGDPRSHGIFDADMQPLAQNTGTKSVVFEGNQRVGDPAAPFELLRIRGSTNDDPTLLHDELCDGLMIWIEEEK